MEPDVLLLDEILAVGDVAFRHKCINAIDLIMRKSAVIFVSHNVTQIYRLCSSAVILEKGSVVSSGKDIGEAIHDYHLLQKTQNKHTIGTGEASVTYCRALNLPPSESGVHFLKTGTSIEVELGVKLDPTHDVARIKGIIWSQEMIPVVDITHTDCQGPLVRRNPKSEIIHLRFKTPALNISPGRYFLSISILTPDTRRILCRHDNALLLQFKGSVNSPSSFILDSQWFLPEQQLETPEVTEPETR